MRLQRAALVIISAGLLTFGLVFALLQVTRSVAAPDQSVVVSPPTPEVISAGVDSLAARIGAGQTAFGVPLAGSEPLLRDLQPGDRLDVLASLPSPDDGRPVSAVIVRGATVLRAATSGDPLMLQVSASDAIALAHLVLGGTRLSYSVWPTNGVGPPVAKPLDEQSARALLGLGPVPSDRTPRADPTPPPPAGVAAVPRLGGFLYQAQPGDTWDSVAAIFSVSAAELRRVNEASPDGGLDPWSLLFIPRKS
jgi:hypothetical protein